MFCSCRPLDPQDKVDLVYHEGTFKYHSSWKDCHKIRALILAECAQFNIKSSNKLFCMHCLRNEVMVSADDLALYKAWLNFGVRSIRELKSTCSFSEEVNAFEIHQIHDTLPDCLRAGKHIVQSLNDQVMFEIS